MQIVEAKLMDLKIDPANVRQTDKAPDEGMIASIREKGLLVPLTVRKNGAGYYVTDGGMRLQALHILARDGDYNKDTPIPCVLRDDDAAAATDISLTSNFVRSDMHPADVYEAFAKLQSEGMSIDEIRKRYGITPKDAAKYLALGALAPGVRKAWRAGKLSKDQAQAFTLETDHQRQESILKRMASSHGNAWWIKQQLVGDQNGASGLLEFVGVDIYEARGGKVIKDLFADSRNDDKEFASNPTLLKKLADEKLQAECDKLIADGWGWAEIDSNNSRYQMDRLDRGGKKPTAADKPKAGCLLHLDYNGKLVIEKWFTKTKAKAAADKATATKKDAATSPTVLSNALKQRLSSQLLKATQQALGDDTYGDALAILLAKIVASQIKPERPSWMPSEVTNKLAEVRAGITAKVMLAAVIKNFDAKNYFSSAPKGIVLSAIKEAGFSDDQFKAANKTKVDIWKFALANVPKTGWLPKELRGPYYTGPSKTAGPAKAAKKKAR